MSEKIQSWCRLTSCSSGEILDAPGFPSFHGTYSVSHGFWGLTMNSDFKLWFDNNVDIYKPFESPKAPKRMSEKVWRGGGCVEAACDVVQC